MGKQIKGILGTKLGMTQVFNDAGQIVPVTVVQAGPCVVTAVRTPDSDGYSAVQLGFGEIDPRKVTKPVSGMFSKAGLTPRRYIAELRTDDVHDSLLDVAEGMQPHPELGAVPLERVELLLQRTLSPLQSLEMEHEVVVTSLIICRMLRNEGECAARLEPAVLHVGK